jgi:2',3'-cyclic-nucleotide 2'-phosphodiesterase (5'-nucleotidase family)
MLGKKSIRIKFIGDVSFNDRYIDLLEADQNPFEAISPLLQGADLVVGNLECLAEGIAQNERKVPRIRTSLKALNALKYLNLGLVSLATNHVYDNLEEGFENSVRKLDELGIAHLGASLKPDEATKPFVFEKNEAKIGFLNYVHEDTNPRIPKDTKVYVNMYDLPKILEAIRSLKIEVDKVVVLLHWGGKCDYGYFPHQEQVDHARQMVDAGADAIIGHHTHTFQSNLIYKNAPIYFSLGNFCFDDIVMDKNVFKIRESGRKSGVVELDFLESVTNQQVFPFRLNGLIPTPENNLKSGFDKWRKRFNLIRNVPGAFSVYYYLLKRWEPVHFHAQLNNTTIVGVAIQKVKRIFGLG